MVEEDPTNATPLGEPDQASRSVPRLEIHELPDVARGRMLCVINGRLCYRRASQIGIGDGMCPDERHGMPIQAS